MMENYNSGNLEVEKFEELEPGQVLIPKPFYIGILGEVASRDGITKSLEEFFTGKGLNNKEWGVKFFSNTKLDNPGIWRSFTRLKGNYKMLITGQITNFGKKRIDVLSELNKDKYVLYFGGSDPKERLTPERALELVSAYLEN